MNPVYNILVVIDPSSEQQWALTKGAQLARGLNSRLELYACDTRAKRQTRLVNSSSLAATPKRSQELRTRLEELAAPLRQQGLEVATEADFGEPLHEKLADKIHRSTAELIVKDTHHHSLLRRSFLSNTDWQLIRACSVPLLLVKPKPWSAVPRVVAALDPGHQNDKPAALDERILEFAHTCTQHIGGELEVLHAFVPMTIIAAALSGEPPTDLAMSANDIEREKDAKVEELSQIAAKFGVTRDHIHVEVGGPSAVLPHAASQLQADILAMGAISRSAIERSFIGSTAEDVLESLPCDALIIKPPDFSAALPIWSVREAG